MAPFLFSNNNFVFEIKNKTQKKNHLNKYWWYWLDNFEFWVSLNFFQLLLNFLLHCHNNRYISPTIKLWRPFMGKWTSWISDRYKNDNFVRYDPINMHIQFGFNEACSFRGKKSFTGIYFPTWSFDKMQSSGGNYICFQWTFCKDHCTRTVWV